MLPSPRELAELGMTELEWLEAEGFTTPVNLVIEKTSALGSPSIVQDNSDDLQARIDANNAEMGGCGCTTTPSPLAAGWLVLASALLGVRRRAT